MKVFNRHVSGRSLTVFSFELVLILGSIVLAGEMLGSSGSSAYLSRIVTVTALCLLCFYYTGLYDLTEVQSSRELLVRLLQGTGAAAALLAIPYVIVPSAVLDAGTFVTALAVFGAAVLAWRLIFNSLSHDPHLEERILILGTGHAARMLTQEIWMRQDFAYRLVGFIDHRDGPCVVRRHDILGEVRDIRRVVAERQVTRIVISLADRRGHLPIDELLRAKLAGVRVEDATTTYERLTGKILIDDLKPSWLIFSDGFRASRLTRVVKRTFDLVLSTVGFLLATPLMLVSALAVWRDSPGPILYSQQRVGENGRIFTLYKFRSMRVDAENGTPVWAIDNDDRVTRTGRFLRATRLDELPQLWNVMLGDMSFVGPRPERPYFVQQLRSVIPFYQERHSVKPGVTGWAQVRYRYGASVEDAVEKLRYDLYYIKHMSIIFDLTIVFDTIKVILSRKGAQ
jgi:sugar transferase (PEP-CTERM system associated)